MGISTNAYIGYGIAFEEDIEFPWETGDIGSWWREWCGFKPSVDIYTPEGNYVEGITGAERDRYWEERTEWDKNNPVPVEECNYCSGDYPMYALIVPGSRLTANRGYPMKISRNLDLPEKDKVIEFLTIMRQFNISDEDPEFLLMSYTD